MSQTDEDLKLRAVDALASSDAKTLGTRAERLVWLARFPKPSGVMSRLETLFLMEEARVCYINGQYVAVLFTTLAFIEQTLVEELEDKNAVGSWGTFEKAISTARSERLFSDDLLDRTDNLRSIRNPLAHRKPDNHAKRLVSRFRESKVHPTQILEEDAQDAIAIMYEYSNLTINSGKIL